MATLSPSDLEITEVNSDGVATSLFTFKSSSRWLQARPKQPLPKNDGRSYLLKCLSPFLPAGYPSTVAPDYTAYQIYDSLQAFASTIAGLLSSRAIFVGMGVGSEDASLVTTMLLYIAQETIGRIATILFAHRFSQRIEAEVKFYRFFADIVNDIAFVLDCLSPGLPILGRVLALCVSNACRAACGVAGGSSKAILSSHFARAGNIGELNAKDGSQETVVSLVGMWVGGLVVSKVHATVETWLCLIPLLSFHLWANWKAVKSVRLNTLNADRASIFFRGILDGRVLGPNEVAEDESILGFANTSQTHKGHNINRIQVGVNLEEFLQCMQNSVTNDKSLSYDFIHLVKMFEEEAYLLWINPRQSKAVILLKESATSETQAKCFCHALRCSRQLRPARTDAATSQSPVHRNVDDKPSETGPSAGSEAIIDDLSKEYGTKSQIQLSSQDEKRNDTFELLSATLRKNREQWDAIQHQARQAGWDLNLTNLAKGQGRRIRTKGGLDDNKKDQ